MLNLIENGNSHIFQDEENLKYFTPKIFLISLIFSIFTDKLSPISMHAFRTVCALYSTGDVSL